jgi:hypothetical protein
VVVRLFSGLPLRFIQEQKAYLAEHTVKGTDVSMPLSKVVNELFPKKCEDHALRREHFYKFLVQVQAQIE